jgi:hypothetical protein
MLIFITFWGVNRKELFFKPTQARILYSQKMQRLAQVISNNLPTNKKVTLTVHQEAYLAILANAKPAFQHAALEEMFHKNELDSYVNQLNNPLEPMLWVIDTGYLIKYAPLVLKQRLLPIIESKIQRKIPNNTLLCIPLNRNK